MKHPLYRPLCEALDLPPEDVVLYPSSSVEFPGFSLQLTKVRGQRHLLAAGAGAEASGFTGRRIGTGLFLCPADHPNRKVLNRLLPWTAPQAFGRRQATFGTGDRLGLATPGHIRALSRSLAKPILAQQSMRELSLTGRTYRQVLDDVCYSVFQEGYDGGFGADGDHLKTAGEIANALAEGYTMITLDGSQALGTGVESLDDPAVLTLFDRLPAGEKRRYRETYLGQVFELAAGAGPDQAVVFNETALARCVLLYKDLIVFAADIWNGQIKAAGRPVDFELSIDETGTVTTPQGHFFVAAELEALGVEATSLAPRFVGEFQKGIDYIGVLAALDDALAQHAAIASHFGHKLSVHSGSDKFSAFPLIGARTGGRLHLKTSGTSWLEAVATIAQCDPDLYRLLHKKALVHFQEATAFYHVSAEPDRIVPLEEMADADLPCYLEGNDSRQLLHITYGFLLADPALRARIYQLLERQEDVYADRLAGHIGRHLHLLGLD